MGKKRRGEQNRGLGEEIRGGRRGRDRTEEEEEKGKRRGWKKRRGEEYSIIYNIICII